MAQTDKMQPPADRPYKKHLDDAASHQTDDYREPGVIQKAVEKGELSPCPAGLAAHDEWMALTRRSLGVHSGGSWAPGAADGPPSGGDKD